jgi:hypothetical protein
MEFSNKVKFLAYELSVVAGLKGTTAVLYEDMAKDILILLETIEEKGY